MTIHTGYNKTRNFLYKRTIHACLTVGLLVITTSDAFAQLEEIVVTARKRQESLQDTPIAVSVFSAADLRERNLTTVGEVSQFAPNVQFDSVASESGGAGGASQIAIRGIGQTDYVITIEPGVGMYMDGVYIGKSVGSLIDVIDLEQIEVLRGPQGTLFGKNTIGGAISVTSKRPSKELDAYIDITGGNYNRFDVKTSLSGSVNDRFRLRLSGASQNRDGHVKRLLNGQREGEKESLFGRLVAEWNVTDNFMATGSFDITNSNEEQAGEILLQASENGFFPLLHNTFGFPACVPPAAVALGLSAGPVDPGRFSNPDCFNSQWVTELDSRENFSIGPNRADATVWGTSVVLDWDLELFKLKSITAYRNVDVDTFQDVTPNPTYVGWNGSDIFMESISQELQLSGKAFSGRLTYLLGFYWLNESGEQEFVVEFNPFTLVTGGSIDNTSTAVFAQGTYNVTDKLALTVGARFTKDNIRWRPEQEIREVRDPIITAFIPTVVAGTPVLPRVFVESDDNNVSPMATVSYDFNDELMTYFTYSQGYKAGGFTMRSFPPIIPGVTTPITDPRQIIPSFGPEEVEMFELGIKSEYFQRRMRLNLAGFVTNYDDLQLLAATGVGGLVPTIFNAGDARLWGIEAETLITVSDRLRLNGSLGWLEHKYLRVDPNASGVTKDKDLVNTPDWTASAGATLDVINNDLGYLFLRADWSYKGSQFKDTTNEPLLHQDAYNIVNASLSWESADQHWLATLGVTNLTDETYIVSGVTNAGVGVTIATPSRPREWFFKLRYTY